MTPVAVTCDACSAIGVGRGRLQDEMSHTLILYEGRQCGITHGPDYLFWIITFEVIGSNLQTLLGLEDLFSPVTAFPLLCLF